MPLPPLGDDPLALVGVWPCEVSLIPFEQALEQSVFRSGLSRSDWLKRLAADLHKPQLLPLLWLLPRGWKLAPAQLPVRLQALGGILERELLSPALLAALADDLPHLWPGDDRADAVALWCSSDQPNLPQRSQELLRLPEGLEPSPTADPRASELSGGLLWQNAGLRYEQSWSERQRNSLTARVLNRLGANLLPTTQPHRTAQRFTIDACDSSAAWLKQLLEQGWQASAQLRASIASFGLGASLPNPQGGWLQVPLALPIRTGLLGDAGTELRALLPHSCLELELRHERTVIRLQYYQGTEGMCGWEALNDLHRPWQNDRQNGTVRYLGERYAGERLIPVLELCEWIALVHNLEASEDRLRMGGYGALGFCIDSSALLQQALEGHCDLFPVLLSGIWRERLLRRSRAIAAVTGLDLDLYQRALERLPHDGSLMGAGADDARRRLIASQPVNSPFALVQQLVAGSPQESR